ncbi:hypothetical protein [Dictyobacter kobayashii]|nr:hypothetical protein [Dictyobacter kobayashii]
MGLKKFHNRFCLAEKESLHIPQGLRDFKPVERGSRPNLNETGKVQLSETGNPTCERWNPITLPVIGRRSIFTVEKQREVIMLTIDIDTARRFILGKQGLWPGRRWRGIEGTEQAMRAMEYLQLDPLQIIARSQDIKLHSRVLDYTPGMWEDVTYQQRKFFDWGGWLAVRAMDELPYWRVVMRRERDSGARLLDIARNHADAIAEMRAVLHERGIVGNRDFAMATRTRTQSYRAARTARSPCIICGALVK